MPNIPPDALMAALGAVHQTGVKTDPSTGAPYDQQGGGGGAGGGDPNAQGGGDPNADPNAQGGGQDPSEQAIWDAFPSTDPAQIDQLAQQAQGGDPSQLAQLIEGFMQQAQQDRDDFEQRQEMSAQRFFEAIGAGTPDQSSAPPQDMAGAGVAPPGVGGGGAGY